MISNTRRTTALTAINKSNLMRLIVSKCYNRFKGESVFGYRFNDENLSKQFTHRGQVAMANNGKDTNGEDDFKSRHSWPDSFANRIHSSQRWIRMDRTACWICTHHIGSQFFITFDACPHLDGQAVIFGQLVDRESYEVCESSSESLVLSIASLSH